ncbi:N-6 DNA methylase [Mitsuokella sp. oral taxon 131]|uniref:N-6 DNA methylase n=1 Tax=Mitsuokella sp. oral taxon 131 TaxID=1321780 RepID=UPI0003AE2295|nr:SNF2-related protein [Mitsuokella sp. oral taxon 131]ERL04152.1 protein, SNF2 family [Mitsuokella sp. oral taxon 131 str. W9106]
MATTRGKRAVFQRNLTAIRVLKAIESEGREATQEEQKLLQSYSGFGGFSEAFDPQSKSWASEYDALRQYLSASEYASARATVLDAYYTPPEIIRAIYDGLQHLGFEGGNILEPSCGAGRFFGAMPRELREKSHLYGVELDALSARIAAKAYPDADIAQQGFETTRFADGSFDLAIGNVPFGNTTVSADMKYLKDNLLIHDYFLTKMLDEVRPGGMVCAITSAGTLDKENPRLREALAKKAELVTAIRLPETAFQGAGTSVVSDILVFRKKGGRENPLDVAAARRPVQYYLWRNAPKTHFIGDTYLGEAYPINEIYTRDPSGIYDEPLGVVLGKFALRSGPFGKELTVRPKEGMDLAEGIRRAFEPFSAGSIWREGETELALPMQAKERAQRAMGFFVEEGALCFVGSDGVVAQPDFDDKKTQRVLSAVHLRDAGHDVLTAQEQGCSDEELRRAQKRLSALYASHVKQYGRLADDKTLEGLFSVDPGYTFIRAFEIKDERGKFKETAAIFTERTIVPDIVPDHADTPEDALVISMQQKGCVDLSYMAELTGSTVRELTDALEYKQLYFDEETKAYIQSDEYLSGDIREKIEKLDALAETLHAKREAQEIDLETCAARLARIGKNRAALSAVLPKDLAIGEISVGLGTPWLRPALIEEFVRDTLSLPYYERFAAVRFSPEANTWRIEKKGRQYGTAAEEQFAAGGKSAYELIELCLNQKNAEVRVPSERDPEVHVVDPELTIEAQMKQQEIRAAFDKWLRADAGRVQEVTDYYNRHFNNTRLREYDGSKLTFPGMTNTIRLKPHQKDAVAHSLFGGNTLFAHCVGAGKTFEMVASIMEAKRLGLSHKALMVVPNHLVEQTGEEFQRLYPRAKILVARKKDFEKQNRQEFVSRIATQNWDAVIMGASQFGKVKLSKERETAMRLVAIQELEESLYRMRGQATRKQDFSVRAIETLIRKQREKLRKLQELNQKDSDETISFEELGVDKLVIDEAHAFKNLAVTTSHSRVAGIGTTDHVQKSWDLYMKTQYLNELTGERGLIFATGTPISNSMTELYTMQRYLSPKRLEALGLEHFDAWAASFGEITVGMELRPEGKGYQLKERFSRFHNLPELMNLFKEFADVRTADMLAGELPVPKAEIIVDQAPASPNQKRQMEEIEERADCIRKKRPQSIRKADGTLTEDSFLLITNAGRKLALDSRLLDESQLDLPGSKVNRCVKNVLSVYTESRDRRSAQVIFCDDSTSTGKGKGKFNLYDDIRGKLIAAGVPKEEIAVVQEVKEKDKQKLFDRVRAGEVRVLLGSTSTLGGGTNIQDKLIAQHDLSVPWRPADLEQRMGRIIRPGNENKEVKIYRYVTEGTFDAYLWQTVETKQRYIAQAITSKNPVRSMQDADEVVLSYAEIKAIATGNPFIKEKMELENDLTRLQIAHSEYDTKQQYFRKLIEIDGPKRMELYEKKLAALLEDKLRLAGEKPEDAAAFSMTINDVLCTDPIKAGELLGEAAKGGYTAMKNFTGAYKGMPLTLLLDRETMQPVLTVRGKTMHRVVLSDKPGITMKRLSMMGQETIDRIKEVQEERDKMAANIADAKEKVKQPFPYAEEEAKKKARLIAIHSAMTKSTQASREEVALQPPRSEAAIPAPQPAMAR